MARKRSSRTQGGSSSPNAALVVFLVLFILATLGLGGWVYTIFGDRHKWEDLAKKAESKISAARKAEDWAKLKAYETLNALGDPTLQDDKSSEFEEWKNLRGEVFVDGDGGFKLKDGSKFDAEKDKDSFKKVVEGLRKELGWDPATNRYKTIVRDRLAALEVEVTKERTARYALQQEKVALEQKYRSLDDKYEKGRSEQLEAIKTGNATTLAAAKEKTKEMTNLIIANEKQREALNKLGDKHREETTRLTAVIRELEDRVRRGDVGGGEKMAAKGPKGAPRAAPGVEPHALMLDISKGKPLWDRPRGKILRIDEKERRVYINVGSADGVKTGLNFNVFAAGWDGRAEGAFKGTIEVMRVEPRTAMAKITSLYDAQGNEISLNDASPSKILRGGGNAWKEGDLLFNMVWGAHVAIVGVVDWSGRDAVAAAAQQDELQAFLRTVESQGVEVDAYLDLRDAQVKGTLTPKTAYLVIGQKVWAGKGADAARAKAVNDALAKLRQEAVERGMFLISPENLMNVLGYRRPRSRTDTELSHFRPGMPAAGVSLTGVAGGEGGAGGSLADLTGRWSGKLAGGGQLRMTFKSDGGCVWQLVLGGDTLTGFTNVTRAGKDFQAVVQNRPVLMRLLAGAGGLQIGGGGMEATLSKE